jgi:hypothetical protein
MLDFWFSMGTTVMDPQLLTALKNATPVFTKVKRIITENGHTVVSNNPASGLLENAPTTRVRLALRAYLKPIAPTLPISIYAAGKMSQLLVIPEIKFGVPMKLANTAYLEACTTAGVTNDPSNFSALFPGFLGLCLLDANLTTLLAQGPGSDADEAIEEFGIDPDPANSDLKVINQLLTAPSDFLTAQQQLLQSAGWQVGCREQYFFWVGAANKNANERAILP